MVLSACRSSCCWSTWYKKSQAQGNKKLPKIKPPPPGSGLIFFGSGHIENAQSRGFFIFFDENIVETNVQSIAECSRVKEQLAQFSGNNFFTIRAKFTLDVTVQKLLEIFKGIDIIRNLDFAGLNGKTTTAGHRFGNRPVYPAAGLGEFGEDI
jgi:hypothetical protein